MDLPSRTCKQTPPETPREPTYNGLANGSGKTNISLSLATNTFSLSQFQTTMVPSGSVAAVTSHLLSPEKQHDMKSPLPGNIIVRMRLQFATWYTETCFARRENRWNLRQSVQPICVNRSLPRLRVSMPFSVSSIHLSLIVFPGCREIRRSGPSCKPLPIPANA